MTRDLAADVVEYLAGAVPSLVPANNLFVGLMPAADGPPETAGGATVPSLCVSVLGTGGSTPVPYLGQGRTTYRQLTAQVKIRGAPNDYSPGSTLARTVFDALNLATLSPYKSVRCRESAPAHMGRDESDRDGWVINLTADQVDDGLP